MMALRNTMPGHQAQVSTQSGYSVPDGELSKPFKNTVTFHGWAVTIETERLVLFSVQEKHKEALAEIRNNPVTMEKFANGNPLDKDRTRHRVDGWMNRWKNDNPFSAFAVTLKSDPGKTIGYVVAGFGDDLEHNKEPGHGYSSLAYIIDHRFWNNYYGRESVRAVVDDFLPIIAGKGYKVQTEYNVSGESGKTAEEPRSLKYVYATTREDHIPSIKLLEALGFERVEKQTQGSTSDGQITWKRNIYYIKEIQSRKGMSASI